MSRVALAPLRSIPSSGLFGLRASGLVSSAFRQSSRPNVSKLRLGVACLLLNSRGFSSSQNQPQNSSVFENPLSNAAAAPEATPVSEIMWERSAAEIEQVKNVVDAREEFSSITLASADLLMAWHNLLLPYFDQPWMVTIMTATILVRSALFPLARSNKITRSPEEAAQLQAKMQEARSLQYSSDPRDQAKLLELRKQLSGKMGQSFAPLLRAIPPGVTFFLMFLGVRSLPSLSTDLATGGMFWFKNLAVADPTYILPCISVLSTWATILINGHYSAPAMKNSKFFKIMQYMGIGLPVVFMPFMAQFPSVLFVYWIVNSMFTTMQTVLLGHPAARRLMRLPAVDASAAAGPAANVDDLFKGVAGPSGARVSPPPATPPPASPNFNRFSQATQQSPAAPQADPISKVRQAAKRKRRF